MRYLLIVLILTFTNPAYAKWDKFKTKDEVKNADRYEKSQEDLDKQKNKSQHDLKGKKLNLDNTFGRNFSFCDFKNTDIRGITFTRCNFSFARNLDKAETEGTTFIECNMTGIPEDEMPDNMINCNTNRVLEDFTDAEIEEMFK